jgi:hypothetical protein
MTRVAYAQRRRKPVSGGLSLLSRRHGRPGDDRCRVSYPFIESFDFSLQYLKVGALIQRARWNGHPPRIRFIQILGLRLSSPIQSNACSSGPCCSIQDKPRLSDQL